MKLRIEGSRELFEKNQNAKVFELQVQMQTLKNLELEEEKIKLQIQLLKKQLQS